MFRHLGQRNTVGVVSAALAVIAGASAYAFTATNTVPAHSAGAGAAVVSGYTVSAPATYTFSPDGKTMVGVTFSLDKAASDVAVALSAGDPVNADWVDCGASIGLDVSCTFPNPVANGDGLKLSVAAVSTGTITIGS